MRQGEARPAPRAGRSARPRPHAPAASLSRPRAAAGPRPHGPPLQAAFCRGQPFPGLRHGGGKPGRPSPRPVAPRARHRVPHPPPSSTPARCGAALVSLSPSSGAPLHTPHPRGLSRAHPLSLSLLIPFLRLEGSGEIVSRENTLLLAPRTQRTETLREEPSPRCPRRIGTGLGREVPAEVSPPTGAQAQPTSPPPPPPGPHLGRVFALARLLRCKAGRRLLCV